MSDHLKKLPRDSNDNFSNDIVTKRLEVARSASQSALNYIGGQQVPYGEAKNNVENMVGYAQVPLGLAGPFNVNTEAGDKEVYVPLATTEGAMVASFSRGMNLLNRSGGVRSRVVYEGLTQSPIFVYESAEQAQNAQTVAEASFDKFAKITTELSNHGRLKKISTHLLGKRLTLNLVFTTGDAIGINMVTKATEACSQALAEQTKAKRRYVHGEDFEKRASSRSLSEGRGRSVVADAVVSKADLLELMRVTPEQMVDIWKTYAFGFAHLGTHNTAIQSGNAIAAIFIACGQDAAYTLESATGLLDFEVNDAGDLYTSVFMPSLMVGTVGGGSNQGTAKECLQILGCHGAGHANTFAEIIAATVLAGDISLMAAFSSHEFVNSHERLGRNRPK